MVAGSWDRWQVLAASMVAYSVLGMGDCFGLYSGKLKDTFELTQSELDTIGTAPFFFNLAGFAIIPGILNDRYGGQFVMVCSGVLSGLGLALFYATLVGAVPISPALGVVNQLGLCEALRSWGFQFPSAAVMPCHMRNFRAQPAVSARMVAAIKCASRHSLTPP
jgi:hypothetical protein